LTFSKVGLRVGPTRVTSQRARRAAARLVCALGVVAFLNACSVIPTSGPNRQQIVAAGTQPDSPYLVVPVSDFTIQTLARFPGPSLYGKFGDYRPPVLQRIGIGDTLDVTVFEAASGGLFSQPVSTSDTTGSHSAQIPPQVVQRDGSITVPYAGRVNVVGQTTPEVEKTIVERLTGKAIEPQAIVTLSQNLSNSVSVTGEAVVGARVPLSTRGDHILDVIAEAGGIIVPAHETFLELSRGNRTVRVPFQTLLAEPKENIFARPGDTLTVVRYPLTFTAIGATGRNSVEPFDAIGISLEEAVGKASGLLDDRADPQGVFVLRYEPVAIARNYPGLTPQQAALNLVPVAYVINLRDPNALFLARRFSVHDKDIVYVSNSPFSDLSKVLAIVGAVTSPVVQGVAAVSYFR
jgi:polysaccharide export outer membrane protein